MKLKEFGSCRGPIKSVSLNLSGDLNKALGPILNLSGGIDEEDGKPQDSRYFDRDTNRGLHDANPFPGRMVLTFACRREYWLVGPNYFCGFNHLLWGSKMQHVTGTSFPVH
jgi:hypothetical protein